MGLRLPPFLPAHSRHKRHQARHSGARAHRYSHRTSGGRHTEEAEIHRGQRVPHEFRAQESGIHRAPRHRQARTDDSYSAQRGGQRHRVCEEPQESFGDKRPAQSEQCGGDILPRRTRTLRKGRAAEGMARRQEARNGGHKRLRHGHRQARRARGDTLRLPQLARSLLPGSGTCRTRRAEIIRCAALQQQRQVKTPETHSRRVSRERIHPECLRPPCRLLPDSREQRARTHFHVRHKKILPHIQAVSHTDRRRPEDSRTCGIHRI